MSGLYLKNKFAKELVMRLKQSTVGKTFYVDGTYGNDSGSGLYPFDAKKTVQGAVDAVTTNRGDVVIVGAGRYYENVRITKSKMTLMGAQTGGKQSVSIRPAGIWTGASDTGSISTAEADPVYGYTSMSGVAIRGSAVTINAASVEVCGLEFDASGFKYDGQSWYVYSGVYVGDGGRIDSGYNYDCNGSYIHDCIFKRGAHGIDYDGAAEDHRLEHNLFYRQEGHATKGCVYIAPGTYRQSLRINVIDNLFTAIENGAYGIDMYSSDETKGCIFLRNVFHQRATKAAKSIRLLGAGEHLVAGNWFGIDNLPALVSTDWGCGNFKTTQSSTETYISEA